LRPVGFTPTEISALINDAVVSQHAEEAAFLWTMRNRAVREPHYSLQDLAALDQRVEAHLDGLRIAENAGWTSCRTTVANGGAGDVFALAVLAFGSGDRERMLDALNAGCALVKRQPGLVSALGWLDYQNVSPWISRLLDAKSPLHRAVGIAASAVHRQDPGAPLNGALDDSDASLRARALRAVGELKRVDLVNHLRGHLRDEDDSCRFWAAWSLTLHREPAGLPSLVRYTDRDDITGQRALQVALRAMSLDEGRQRISSLAQESRSIQAAVMGAGILGDPASVPWLIRKAESPELARIAGEAFTMITGVDLSYHDLDQDPPAAVDQDEDVSIEEVLDLDYQSNLPWPSVNELTRWWSENHQAFSPGIRYLAGEPITPQSLLKILSTGKQRQRMAAAIELALLEENRMVFEVRAPGGRQQEQLGISTW
jgi:uncharacterized protein (TIGR02270 family)